MTSSSFPIAVHVFVFLQAMFQTCTCSISKWAPTHCSIAYMACIRVTSLPSWDLLVPAKRMNLSFRKPSKWVFISFSDISGPHFIHRSYFSILHCSLHLTSPVLSYILSSSDFSPRMWWNRAHLHILKCTEMCTLWRKLKGISSCFRKLSYNRCSLQSE